MQSLNTENTFWYFLSFQFRRKLQEINSKIGNKKAVSEVIATLLLVLLAITAVSVLGFFIKAQLNKQVVSMSPQLECIEMQANQMIKIENACYNETKKEVKLTLKRAIDNFNIQELDFFAVSEGNKERFRCSRCGNCRILKAGEIKNYYFDVEKAEKISITANKCEIEEKKIGEC